MKEIDFLPEWYKRNRRHRITYSVECGGLGIMLIGIVIWSLMMGRSVSKSEASLAMMATQRAHADSISAEFTGISRQIADLRVKLGFMEESNSRIDVVQILSELSYLIDKRIVLKKIEFNAEGEKAVKDKNKSIRRLAPGEKNQNSTKTGDVRFRISIAGVAADSSDVANLICQLEESVYFCQVIPTFSRNSKKNLGRIQKDLGGRVSEFEIVCYLANFRVESQELAQDYIVQ